MSAKFCPVMRMLNNTKFKKLSVTLKLYIDISAIYFKSYFIRIQKSSSHFFSNIYYTQQSASVLRPFLQSTFVGFTSVLIWVIDLYAI